MCDLVALTHQCKLISFFLYLIGIKVLPNNNLGPKIFGALPQNKLGAKNVQNWG